MGIYRFKVFQSFSFKVWINWRSLLSFSGVFPSPPHLWTAPGLPVWKCELTSSSCMCPVRRHPQPYPVGTQEAGGADGQSTADLLGPTWCLSHCNHPMTLDIALYGNTAFFLLTNSVAVHHIWTSLPFLPWGAVSLTLHCGNPEH